MHEFISKWHFFRSDVLKYAIKYLVKLQPSEYFSVDDPGPGDCSLSV